MKFNNNNVKFAKKFGIDLDINYNEEGTGFILFFEEDEDDNFLEYTIDENEELFFKCQVYGEKIEDLPRWIRTSKDLNRVIEYVGKEFVKKCI